MVGISRGRMYVLKRGKERLLFLVFYVMNKESLTAIFPLGGRQEDVHFDKITSRIQKLCYGLNMDFVDPVGFFCYCDTGLNNNFCQFLVDCNYIKGHQWSLPRSYYSGVG